MSLISANGIGMWFKILDTLSSFSVLTNVKLSNSLNLFHSKLNIILLFLGFNNKVFV